MKLYAVALLSCLSLLSSGYKARISNTGEPFRTTAEYVEWLPGTPEGALIFANALIAGKDLMNEIDAEELSAPIESADCLGSAIRPGRNEEPQRNPLNQVRCWLTLKDGRTSSVGLDLAGVEIGRWGNSTFPRGFYFKGPLAEKMFAAFAKLHERDNANRYFIFQDVSLRSATIAYDFVQYSIELRPQFENGDIQGPAVLVCGKEFTYEVGQPRPEIPDFHRCDFIYEVGTQY